MSARPTSSTETGSGPSALLADGAGRGGSGRADGPTATSGGTRTRPGPMRSTPWRMGGRAMPDNGAYEQIEQRTLEAVRQPRRLRDIAEYVNENRPGWDILSDAEVAKVLAELHHRGLVRQIGA